MPKQLIRTLAVALVVVACAQPRQSATTTPVPARASRAGGSPLRGTWTLTAADEIQPGGARVHSYGSDPRGLLIVDDSGQYSLQIFRTGRRKFVSGDKRRGTPEEYSDAVLGMSSHTGRCFIDSVDNTLVFQIDLAAYPNWEGTEQRRAYALQGDQLSYQLPASASGNGTIPISEWRRVR